MKTVKTALTLATSLLFISCGDEAIEIKKSVPVRSIELINHELEMKMEELEILKYKHTQSNGQERLDIMDKAKLVRAEYDQLMQEKHDRLSRK